MSKKIKDWGRDLPGAAKHRLNIGAVTLTDFEGMTFQEIKNFAQKKYLWGKAEEHSEEVSPFFILAEEVIRANLPTAPSLLNPYDPMTNIEEREQYDIRVSLNYANAVEQIRNIFKEDPKDFFKNSKSALQAIIKYEEEHSHLTQELPSLMTANGKRALGSYSPFFPKKEGESADESRRNDEEFDSLARRNIGALLPVLAKKGMLKTAKHPISPLFSFTALTWAMNDHMFKKIKSLSVHRATRFQHEDMYIDLQEVWNVIENTHKRIRSELFASPEEMKNKMNNWDWDLYYHDEAKKAGIEKQFKFVIDGLVGRNDLIQKKEKEKKVENVEQLQEALENFEKEQRTQVMDNLKQVDYPHLKTILRIGPSYREGKNVDEHTYGNTFNFSAIQFGESLSDKERQVVLNMGYDAFKDLARAFEINEKELGMFFEHRHGDGFMKSNPVPLAIALGARGHGKKALAHFEPDLNVINLTRMKGAGSLAHEFGHAFEFAMTGITRRTQVDLNKAIKNKNALDIDTSMESAMLSLMYKDRSSITMDDFYAAFRKNFTDRLNDNLTEAFKASPKWDLTDFMARVSLLKEEVLKTMGDKIPVAVDWAKERGSVEFYEFSPYRSALDINTFVKYGHTYESQVPLNQRQAMINAGVKEVDMFKSVVDILFKDYELTPRQKHTLDNGLINSVHAYIALAFMDGLYNGIKNDKNIEKDFDGIIPDNRTQFYKEALYFDQGVEGKYYSRPTELFARAFETVVGRKMTEKGMANDYLFAATKGRPLVSAEIDWENVKIITKERTTLPRGEDLDRFEKIITNIVQRNFTPKPAVEMDYITSHSMGESKKIKSTAQLPQEEQMVMPNSPVKAASASILETDDNGLSNDLDEKISETKREYKKMEQIGFDF